MHAQVAPLAEIFKLNQRLLVAALDGISAADAARRFEGNGNSPQWIAGHAVTSRALLAKIVGAGVEPPWPDLFGRGAKPRDAKEYPLLATILRTWDEVSASLMKRLETVGEADLRAPAPFNLPVADKTVLGAVSFLALHESYHVGQLGYLRKLLGRETLAG